VRKLTKTKKENVSIDDVYDKLEDVDNKLEKIKSDTHNLNRITTLSNSPKIIQELRKIVGKSEVKAAILHMTKEEIGATELAKAIGISPTNLARDMKPFLGNKGYIVEIRKGSSRIYQRSELIDLSGYETDSDFQELLTSWETKKAAEAQTNSKAEQDAA
jgi:DNA-binding transcriptional ArsR family regulator